MPMSVETFIQVLSVTNRRKTFCILALAALLSFGTNLITQSPQNGVIVFYRVRTPDQPKGQSGIRKIFDRKTPADPDQNPTIYQMTAGGATRLASIAKGEFFELRVRPGHYSFSWTSGPARGEQTLVSVTAAQPVFVQVQFRSITEVSSEIAVADLKDLRPTSDIHVFDSAVRLPPDMTWRQQPPPAQATNDREVEPQQPSVEVASATPPPQPATTFVGNDTQTEIVLIKIPQPRTLGWIRQTYVNQPIVVRAVVDKGVLADWYVSRKEPTRYKREPLRPLLARYGGQTAKVVAIQMPATTSATGTPKGASEDDIVDPQFELIAQFPDGTLAMTSTRLDLLADRTKLASSQKLREAEMTKNLALIIGKPLYATGLSTLYEPDTTIEEIKGSREILKRLSAARIPVLEPLTIVAGKYISAEDGVLIKLRLPTGSEALSFTSRSLFDAAPAAAPFIERISGQLLAAVPMDLTTNDVAAIKQGELFRGMSGTAVSYMYGPPDSETGWGIGGKQRIYFKGIVVHFDNKNKVVDWQVPRTK